MVRVAFDPEALPEHPGAQLASFGTPLVDRLLADAVRAGPARRALPGRPEPRPRRAWPTGSRRALTLPAGPRAARSGASGRCTSPRPSSGSRRRSSATRRSRSSCRWPSTCTTAGRCGTSTGCSTAPTWPRRPGRPCPRRRHGGLASAYPIARDRVVRTLAALANARARELGERLDRQVARMARYYADLRAEVEEQAERARGRGEDLGQVRRAARGPRPRGAAPRSPSSARRATLRVHLRLINLLVVHQPKLLIRTRVTAPARGPVPRRPAGAGLGPAGREPGGHRLSRSVAIRPSSSASPAREGSPARLRRRQASGPTMTRPVTGPPHSNLVLSNS